MKKIVFLGLIILQFTSLKVFAGCSPEPVLGSICFTASNFCPNNYFTASGQTLSISSYQALFSLLGTKYGGDGRVSFSLPDLRGRSISGTPNNNNQFLSSGMQQIEFTANYVRTHSHNVNLSKINRLSGTLRVNNSGANNDNPMGKFLANLLTLNPSNPTGVFPYRDSGTEVPMLQNMITGRFNQPVVTTSYRAAPIISIEGPRLVLNACIAVKGSYPSRS